MIQVRNVSISAGAFSLSNVSLEIPTGDYGVLMGKTGQGKTTLLEAICGLRSITSGSIVIDGVDVSKWSPSDRGIGYVPQDLALFPTLSVREHLSFALRLRRHQSSFIRARTQELAERLSIAPLLDRGVMELSGGEAQRVALGRALSFRPTVLLLDEPLSALDDATREQMQDLLKQLAQMDRITTLHVTHSLQEAKLLGHKILVITDGLIAPA
jgi:ABC-type sugar transport system ATPase subunit